VNAAESGTMLRVASAAAGAAPFVVPTQSLTLRACIGSPIKAPGVSRGIGCHPWRRVKRRTDPIAHAPGLYQTFPFSPQPFAARSAVRRSGGKRRLLSHGDCSSSSIHVEPHLHVVVNLVLAVSHSEVVPISENEKPLRRPLLSAHRRGFRSRGSDRSRTDDSGRAEPSRKRSKKSPLPLCREGQAGADVLNGQFREVGQNFGLGHSRREILQHIGDRDP